MTHPTLRERGFGARAGLFALLLAVLSCAPFPDAAIGASQADISGVLQDAAGDGVGNLQVWVVDQDRGRIHGSGRTGDDGSFSVPQPAEGTRFHLVIENQHDSDDKQVLKTWLGSKGSQSWTGWDLPIGYRARTTDIDIGRNRLAASSGFDVRVSGVTGADVTVRVLRRDGEVVWQASSSAAGGQAGEAGFESLRSGFVPGEYTVEAYATGSRTKRVDVVLKEDSTLSVPIVLEPGHGSEPPSETKPTGSLRGQFTAAGKPGVGRVTLLKDGRTAYSRDIIAGNLNLKGVAAGTYRLRFVDAKQHLFMSVMVTIEDGEDRVMKPKKATRATVTLTGTAPVETSLVLTRSDGQEYFQMSGPSKIVNGKPTIRASYKFVDVIPGQYSLNVEGRDDEHEFGFQPIYAPRTYTKLDLSRSRSVKVSDGGRGGVVDVALKWADSKRAVVSGVVVAACKGELCLRWTDRLVDGRAQLSGLESKPYRIEVREGYLDSDLGPVVEPEEKSPYYLVAGSETVRAVKGSQVSGPEMLLQVAGGL